ncbi:MAG: transcriptional repressor [Acinetobacter sp.]
MYSKWLINKGLTPTAARIVVLEVLAQHSSLTAGDIYIIANKISELKIGTIYRVLSDLEKYSLIKRVLLGQKKSVYKLREQKINCNIRDAKNGELIHCCPTNITRRTSVEVLLAYSTFCQVKTKPSMVSFQINSPE